MFVWFLQEKLFLDGGERDYLLKKLDASKAAGAGTFFSDLLRDLFFGKGFAKPAGRRQPIGPVPLGDIPYLNGGLFLPHGIEQRTEGDTLLSARYANIRVPDAAFVDLFALFRRYSWSLDDTPGGDDREINPDVLGYIFRNTSTRRNSAPTTPAQKSPSTANRPSTSSSSTAPTPAWPPPRPFIRRVAEVRELPRPFTALDDLLFHADGPTCGRLLQEVLPRLSLLDPACGSGAFLAPPPRRRCSTSTPR